MSPLVASQKLKISPCWWQHEFQPQDSKGYELDMTWKPPSWDTAPEGAMQNVKEEKELKLLPSCDV